VSLTNTFLFFFPSLFRLFFSSANGENVKNHKILMDSLIQPWGILAGSRTAATTSDCTKFLAFLGMEKTNTVVKI